ncbi:MAG: FecR domain-containing protein, partial [Pseudoxanthomonas sp.]
ADILVRDYVFEPKEAKFSFSLYLDKGSAIYESGKIGRLAPESVKIDTPTATVGVRGTRFLIEAN